MSSTYERQSKYMSWVLRHGAHEIGLHPDFEGYIRLRDFLNCCDKRQNLTESIVLRIAESCPKKRFGIKRVNSDIFIRANQGHSKNIAQYIDPSKLLVKITRPIEGVFHGTYKKHLESIKANGLNRMSRSHIHISKGHDAISGRRGNTNLLVYVDMKTAMEDGIDFYESENGVILTEGIGGILPVKYLSFALV